MPTKNRKNASVNWRNNAIQFPRLIAELEATGVFALPGALDKVAEEMDLDVQQVCGLISRAQDEWDRIKAATRKTRAELD
jgi:predicted transcriptional regulator YheO